MSELSNLERAVLEAIAAQYPQFAAAFQSQMASLVVTKRENSGAGMFSELAVTDPAALPFDTRGPLNGVGTTVLDKQLAFLVFLNNGRMSLLEGYMLDDGDTKHIDFLSAPFTPVTPMAPQASSDAQKTMPPDRIAQAHTWTAICRDIGFCLVGLLGLFALFKLIFNLRTEALIVPYLLMAAPAAIFLVWVRRLWTWEERGMAPRPLAFAWCTSIWLLFLAWSGTLLYFATAFRALDPGDAVWIFVVQTAGVTLAGWAAYRTTRQRLAQAGAN